MADCNLKTTSSMRNELKERWYEYVIVFNTVIQSRYPKYQLQIAMDNDGKNTLLLTNIDMKKKPTKEQYFCPE